MIIVSPQAEANLLGILQSYELQNPDIAARFDAEYKKNPRPHRPVAPNVSGVSPPRLPSRAHDAVSVFRYLP